MSTDQNTFDIHVYTSVRLKVPGVKATSLRAALDQVEQVDMHKLLDRKALNRVLENGLTAEYIEHDEGPNQYLVNELDANGNTVKEHCLGDDGLPFVNLDEKAAGFDRSNRFMQELLDSVDTLSELEEQYGADTLIDIMYLNNSILTGAWTDLDVNRSMVRHVVGMMPSAQEWLQYGVPPAERSAMRERQGHA